MQFLSASPPRRRTTRIMSREKPFFAPPTGGRPLVRGTHRMALCPMHTGDGCPRSSVGFEASSSLNGLPFRRRIIRTVVVVGSRNSVVPFLTWRPSFAAVVRVALFPCTGKNTAVPIVRSGPSRGRPICRRYRQLHRVARGRKVCFAEQLNLPLESDCTKRRIFIMASLLRTRRGAKLEQSSDTQKK